jgi:hypothetical protein
MGLYEHGSRRKPRGKINIALLSKHSDCLICLTNEELDDMKNATGWFEIPVVTSKR